MPSYPSAPTFALSVVVAMDPCIPPAANVGPPEDFAQEILREFDFGVDYDFGRQFSFGGYDSSSSVAPSIMMASLLAAAAAIGEIGQSACIT